MLKSLCCAGSFLKTMFVLEEERDSKRVSCFEEQEINGKAKVKQINSRSEVLISGIL